MVQCVITADDVTGANATGIVLRKQNLKTKTFFHTSFINPESIAGYDVVSCSTESRAADSGTAYRRVFEITGRLKSPEVKLYNKRTDSTLRGNNGAEIDGMLDALGEHYAAFMVQSYPDAGRVSKDGYLYVNGVLLEHTGAAADPKTPVKTSVIGDIIASQTKHSIVSIRLDEVSQDISSLQDTIVREVKAGNRILIFDAVTNDDIEHIADAAVNCGIPFITVDPGRFTAAVAHRIFGAQGTVEAKKILMAVGSITKITKEQLVDVCQSYPICRVDIDAEKLARGAESGKQEINRAAEEIIANINTADIFCITTNRLDTESKFDLLLMAQELGVSTEELSSRISDGIAETAYRILKASPVFRGLFTSGGDITVALCTKFQTSGIELLDEVIPMVVHGRLGDGEFPGLDIVTKGGMVGGKDGITKCIEYLKEQVMSNE